MHSFGCTTLKPGQDPTVRVTLDIPANHLAGALARLPESVQVWVKEAVQLEPMQQIEFPPSFADRLQEAADLQKRQVEATEKLAERK